MDNYIIKKTKRKTMSITINTKGDVVVAVPKNTSDRAVLNFIDKHSDWIDEKLLKINTVLKENDEIIKYEKIFLLGKKYKAVYIDGLRQIILQDDQIYIPSSYKNKIKNYLRKWYMTYFDEIVVTRTNNLLKKLNLFCKEIVAITSVRRWGSCSSDKKISFNYKILMLDIPLIDYIIVHEVCHLVEMNHGPQFWKKVSVILPDYKELIKRLKNCGYLLQNL